MSDLLQPDEVREMLDDVQLYAKEASMPAITFRNICRFEHTRLCRDYLTLWERYLDMREQRDNLEGRLGMLSEPTDTPA